MQHQDIIFYNIYLVDIFRTLNNYSYVNYTGIFNYTYLSGMRYNLMKFFKYIYKYVCLY